MAKKSRLTKQKLNKLLKAVTEINSFSAINKEGNIIYLDDIYKVNIDSNDIVTFSLLFYNIGIATTTTAFLENITILPSGNGSINEYPVGINNALVGKTLSIKSSVATTNLSNPYLPSDFKASLVIEGGKSNVKYNIENQITLENVGDNVFLNISIFFY